MREILKAVYRLSLRTAMFLSFILPLQLVGSLLLALYLPYHRHTRPNYSAESLKLPYLLHWFDNVDIYIGRDISVYRSVFQEDFYTHWSWLAFRNPLNYFGYTVLGFEYKDSASIVDDNIGDARGQTEGFRHIEIEYNNKTYYEYYYIRKLSQTKCVRIRIGHKLAGSKPGSNIQWVYVISPYHSYDGV